ncbi:hypothetical protein [Streptomyces sp. NBC_01092]|uniref:hypothetical protein n=1 Tax=Streptomyces sp. NBC_01092 TaxID=2903748 RepID=UPI003865E811|nr:hypothetical protein OG254_48710 [Streptomyces sp. NBC_01092]
MASTERTRAHIHTGLAHLRQVAAARGLPPVTWDRKWGYAKLDCGLGGNIRPGLGRSQESPAVIVRTNS